MRMLFLALIIAACLLAPPSLVWFVGAVWGTPHLVWTYRFHDNGDRYNPRAPRHYIDCTYIGWNDAITVPAIDGRCPWVRFFKGAG